MVSQNGFSFEEVSQLRMGIWGDIKTAKTTLSISFPKPIIHFDLDQSFIRAAYRFKHFNIIQSPLYQPLGPTLESFSHSSPPDIIVVPYQVPIKWPGTKIQGMIAMWDAFTSDVMMAYSCPWVRSIVVDTGTMVWKIATAAHLERVQEKNPDRQSLIQIEYSRPNTELRGLYGGASTFGKNLCITHHVGGLYEDKLTARGVEQQRVGDTWDGFSGMGSLVDMVGRTYIQRTHQGSIPSLDIHTCGLTLAVEGKTIQYPTFDSVLEEVNQARRQGL